MKKRNVYHATRLNTNKRIKTSFLLLLLITGTTFCACSKSNELVPKTGDNNSEYLLQKGPLLSNDDRELINKRLEEYNDATGL
ncbi:hypothetical protein [Pedobacter caeni]|nr:hypothetical protein [Pedobacter caeni]